MSGGHQVAAGDASTARAAQTLLETGGNAFDAAVAAMFTAMIAEPALTSAGGGGHLMACPASGRPVLFDFFVDMPSGPLETENFFPVQVDFGAAVQEFHIGSGSAGVPGNLAGLLRVHERLGRAPRREVLAPAIAAARDGVEIHPCQAEIIRLLTPILTNGPDVAGIFAPRGNSLKGGDRICMPAFASFLEALADEGPNVFYQGMAREIEEWSGGRILEADLRGYSVEEREPIRAIFAGHEILLNPPPAAGGVLMEFTLSLLDGLAPVQPEDFARAFAATNRAREHHLPDAPSKDGHWLPPEVRDRLQADFRHGVTTQGNPEPASRGCTTHVSVLDGEGNAASVTTTNGESCGSLLPGAGFMMNNMLGEADLNPGGFHRHPAGSRLPTMMSPLVTVRDGAVALVSGSGGSNRIRSALVQVLARHLANGDTLEAATHAPRLHLEGGVLQAEPGLEPVEGPWEFRAWPERNVFFGGAHSVAPGGAAGDARRGGCALVG